MYGGISPGDVVDFGLQLRQLGFLLGAGSRLADERRDGGRWERRHVDGRRRGDCDQNVVADVDARLQSEKGVHPVQLEFVQELMMQFVFEKGQRVADVLGVELTAPFLLVAADAGLNETALALQGQRVRRLDGGEENPGNFALPANGAGGELRRKGNPVLVVRNVAQAALGRRRLRRRET